MVSVIVPARNEEACLGLCLQSLVGQTGIRFEIIVVDDGSTDRTREIAESFPGVRVISPGPLRHGWSGKNNALAAGAKVARGEWFLFTDADTVHRRRLFSCQRSGSASAESSVAFLFSRTGSSRLLGEDSDASDFRGTGLKLSPG